MQKNDGDSIVIQESTGFQDMKIQMKILEIQKIKERLAKLEAELASLKAQKLRGKGKAGYKEQILSAFCGE